MDGQLLPQNSLTHHNRGLSLLRCDLSTVPLGKEKFVWDNQKKICGGSHEEFAKHVLMIHKAFCSNFYTAKALKDDLVDALRTENCGIIHQPMTNSEMDEDNVCIQQIMTDHVAINPEVVGPSNVSPSSHMTDYIRSQLADIKQESVVTQNPVRSSQDGDKKHLKNSRENEESATSEVLYVIPETSPIPSFAELVSDENVVHQMQPILNANGIDNKQKIMSLVRLENKNLIDESYSCYECGQIFNQRILLKVHKRTHKDLKSTPRGLKATYFCTECNKGYILIERFNSHMMSHHSNACTQCGLGFKTKETLEKHMLTNHPALTYTEAPYINDITYKCSACEEVFVQKQACDDHILTHYEETLRLDVQQQVPDEQLILLKDDNLQAPVIKTNSQTHLLDHQYSKDTEIEEPRTLSNIDLEENEAEQNVEYSREVPHLIQNESQVLYVCTTCGKGVPQLADLWKHMMVHTTKTSDASLLGVKEQKGDDSTVDETDMNLKLHRCSYCDKRYNTRSEVMVHMLLKHVTTTNKKSREPQDCPICGKRVSNHTSLQNHMLIHTGMKPYTCTYCDKRFRNMNYLKTHVRGHTIEKNFKCSQCGKAFAILSSLKIHERIHSGVKPFLCTDCGKSFIQHGHLKKHRAYYHSNEKPHLCSLCGKVYAHASILARHMQTHTAKKIHMCTVCEKSFSMPDYLKSHMKLMHSGDQKQHMCAICDAVFDVKADFKRHMNAAHNTDNKSIKPYACTYCPKKFNTELAKNKHAKLHTEVKPHKCPDCGKAFVYLRLLRDHMLTHSGVKPHVCHDCGKKFTAASSLNIHMRNHTGERPFPCPYCSKAFTYSGVLKTHIMIHTGEKPHACLECGKGFITAQGLKKHNLVHKGEKENLCSYCGKMFSQLSNLQSHMLMHVEEKPYICHECGKGFCTPQALKKHDNLHKMKKANFCFYCSKMFLQLSDLETHMTSHTGEAGCLCTDCGEGFRDKAALEAHLAMHKTEPDQQYPCLECNIVYSNPSCLKTHMNIHVQGKIFVCAECDKLFGRLSDARKHMRVHTFDRPYVCTYCGDRFRWQANKKRHFQMKHGGEKRHLCSVCGKGFFQPGDLKKHAMTHTNERPHKCSCCSYASVYSSNLKKHVRTHLGKSDVQIAQFIPIALSADTDSQQLEPLIL